MGRLRRWLSGAAPTDRLALVFGVVLVATYALSSEALTDDAGTEPVDARAVAMLAVGVALVVVVLVTGRFPATVAVALVLLSVVWYTTYASRLVDAPTVLAFYLLGATGDRRRQVLVGGLTLAALLLATVGASPDGNEWAVLWGAGWVLAAIVCGEAVHARRLLLDQYAERAARAEAERDAEAERRVAEERLRIARDVHDVLAHTVSVMTVQAGVALDALDRGRGPEPLRAALGTIRSAGRQAMADVRATVAVLRGDAPAGTAPTPGLDRVAELVAAARADGLAVEADVDADPGPVEPLVALTAFRVVQEALTNVTRHARATAAHVRVARAGGDLVVEVRDDGRGATGGAGDGGFGLRGMAERVEALGGALAAGAAPGGGWSVVATLPVATEPGDAAGARA